MIGLPFFRHPRARWRTSLQVRRIAGARPAMLNPYIPRPASAEWRELGHASAPAKSLGIK
jgi:hypothetical protein